MNRIALVIILLSLTKISYTQTKPADDKAAIKHVLNTFMNCLVHKDSIQFYSLFHKDPVIWIGAYKEQTQQNRLAKDSTKKNYFASTYKSFYNSISNLGEDEEKFYNINIFNDESVASVSFDYSFWEQGKKINWGKESWHLVKINNEWKIVSIIFSMDIEAINPEPKKTMQ
jgi:hypothetical protein